MSLIFDLVLLVLAGFAAVTLVLAAVMGATVLDMTFKAKCDEWGMSEQGRFNLAVALFGVAAFVVLTIVALIIK
jgi:hypothetical protein